MLDSHERIKIEIDNILKNKWILTSSYVAV